MKSIKRKKAKNRIDWLKAVDIGVRFAGVLISIIALIWPTGAGPVPELPPAQSYHARVTQ